jgi:hypothetical protein
MFDSDGNGFISLDEFVAGFQQFVAAIAVEDGAAPPRASVLDGDVDMAKIPRLVREVSGRRVAAAAAAAAAAR